MYAMTGEVGFYGSRFMERREATRQPMLDDARLN